MYLRCARTKSVRNAGTKQERFREKCFIFLALRKVSFPTSKEYKLHKKEIKFDVFFSEVQSAVFLCGRPRAGIIFSQPCHNFFLFNVVTCNQGQRRHHPCGGGAYYLRILAKRKPVPKRMRRVAIQVSSVQRHSAPLGRPRLESRSNLRSWAGTRWLSYLMVSRIIFE